MFCSKCGNQISDTAQFCSSCGSGVAAKPAVTTAAPSVGTSQSTPSQPFVYVSNQVPPTSKPPVEFGAAIPILFQNYANFNGRARRSEYWFGYLFVVLVNFGILILGEFDNGAFAWGIFDALYLIWNLGILIPVLSASVRRLHDVGRKGTYLWMGLIPLAGVIILIIELAKDSQPGPNEFGPSTKY